MNLCFKLRKKCSWQMPRCRLALAEAQNNRNGKVMGNSKSSRDELVNHYIMKDKSGVSETS